MAWAESLALAIVAVVAIFPGRVFGLMTSQGNLTAAVLVYDEWFFATLAAGAVAYVFDGYIIGMTAGKVVRNAMLASLGLFLPLALAAWTLGSNHLLWLAFTTFMVARALTLGLKQRGVVDDACGEKVGNYAPGQAL